MNNKRGNMIVKIVEKDDEYYKIADLVDSIKKSYRISKIKYNIIRSII